MPKTVTIIESQEDLSKWSALADKTGAIHVNLAVSENECQVLCKYFSENIKAITPDSRFRFYGQSRSNDGVEDFLRVIGKNCASENLRGLFFDLSHTAPGNNTECIFNLIENQNVPNDVGISFKGCRLSDDTFLSFWKELMLIIHQLPANAFIDLSDNLLSSDDIRLFSMKLSSMKPGLYFKLNRTNDNRNATYRYKYVESLAALFSLISNGETPEGLGLNLDVAGFDEREKNLNVSTHPILSLWDSLSSLMNSCSRKFVNLSLAVNLSNTQVIENLSHYFQRDMSLESESDRAPLRLNFTSQLNNDNPENGKKMNESLVDLLKQVEFSSQKMKARHKPPYRNIYITSDHSLSQEEFEEILSLNNSKIFSERMDRYPIIKFLPRVENFLNKNDPLLINEVKLGDLPYHSLLHFYRETAVKALFYRLKAIQESIFDVDKIKLFNQSIHQFVALDLLIHHAISIIGEIDPSNTMLQNFFSIAKKRNETTQEKEKISNNLNKLISLFINGYKNFTRKSDYNDKTLMNEVNDFLKDLVKNNIFKKIQIDIEARKNKNVHFSEISYLKILKSHRLFSQIANQNPRSMQQAMIKVIESQQQLEEYFKLKNQTKGIFINFSIPIGECAALCHLVVTKIDKIPQNSCFRLCGSENQDDGTRSLLETIGKNCHLSNLSGLFLDCSYMKPGLNTKSIFSLIKDKKVPSYFSVSFKESSFNQWKLQGEEKDFWQMALDAIASCSDNVSFDFSDNQLSHKQLNELNAVLKKVKTSGLSINLKNTYRSNFIMRSAVLRARYDYALSVKSILQSVCCGKIPPGLKLTLDMSGFNELWGEKEKYPCLEEEVVFLLRSSHRGHAQLSFAMNATTNLAKTAVYNELCKLYSASRSFIGNNNQFNQDGGGVPPCYKFLSPVLQLCFNSQFDIEEPIPHKKQGQQRDLHTNQNELITDNRALAVYDEMRCLVAEVAQKKNISENNQPPYNAYVLHYNFLTLEQLESILLKGLVEFSNLMDRLNADAIKPSFEILHHCKERDLLFCRAKFDTCRKIAVRALFYKLNKVIEQAIDDKEKKRTALNALLSQFVRLDVFIYKMMILIIADINLLNPKKDEQQIANNLGLIELLLNGYHDFNYELDDIDKKLIREVSDFLENSSESNRFEKIQAYINKRNSKGFFEVLYITICEMDLPVYHEVALLDAQKSMTQQGENFPVNDNSKLKKIKLCHTTISEKPLSHRLEHWKQTCRLHDDQEENVFTTQEESSYSNPLRYLKKACDTDNTKKNINFESVSQSVNKMDNRILQIDCSINSKFVNDKNSLINSTQEAQQPSLVSKQQMAVVAESRIPASSSSPSCLDIYQSIFILDLDLKSMDTLFNKDEALKWVEENDVEKLVQFIKKGGLRILSSHCKNYVEGKYEEMMSAQNCKEKTVNQGITDQSRLSDSNRIESTLFIHKKNRDKHQNELSKIKAPVLN